MLPAPFRLSTPKDFAIIFKEGRHATSSALAIKWLPTHQPQTKVGFIASKKYFPKAVDRNRAKRLLREVMRMTLFQLKPNLAIIVLYRYKPDRTDRQSISKDLLALLEKNNLLQKMS